MIIGVDIDGVLCEETSFSYRLLARPIQKNIDAVNKLLIEGHTIVLFTARGWNEYEITTDWLMKHGVPYHRLICGKPIFDVYIDDRAVSDVDTLLAKVEKEQQNETT